MLKDVTEEEDTLPLCNALLSVLALSKKFEVQVGAEPRLTQLKPGGVPVGSKREARSDLGRDGHH